MICKCKWEKKKLQFARKKRKLQFACKKRKLQFVRKKTRGGKFDLQVCSSRTRANKKRQTWKGKQTSGVAFICKGWTAMAQEKLVMVQNENSVEVITVKN